MIRTAAVWILVPLLGVCLVSAQQSKARFEVASVRKQAGQMPTEEATSGPRPTFYRRNYTLARLVQYAYRLHDFEVIGGPEWARKDLFEINAKPASASDEQGRQMLRTLLEERFRLVLREQQQDMRFYALVLARKDGRLGPELKRCEDPTQRQPRVPIKSPPPGGVPLAQWCLSLVELPFMLGGVMRAPVVDKTGLSGLWSFGFFYAPPDRLDWPELRDLPSLQVALREHLGLKLEAQRGPRKVSVIESVQQPTEN